MRRFLNGSQNWVRSKIEAWQVVQLRRVVTNAYESVAGYRELYDQHGVSPGDIRTLNDLHSLPFVTKELLRDNIKEFTSTKVPQRKRLYRATGGSTGIPFGFYLTQEDIERELAFLHSSWERVGWRLGDISAVLRGSFIGSEDSFWEYDPFLKDLHVSTYYLGERSYSAYKVLLLRKRPKHLQAYPSAANMLADLVVVNQDTKILSFNTLLLGSENLYEWQVEQIRSAFPTSRIFTWYGHAEQVIFAPACEVSLALHIDPFYGIAELLSADNHEAEKGASAELVGTSLWNLVTPFIRYRTRDVARKGQLGCDECGRQYQLLEKVEGRLQEFIVTGTGRLISMTAINMHSDVFDNVAKFQFHQAKLGEVTFRIVPRSGYSDLDSQKIDKELRKKLGADMMLRIELVDHIQEPVNGKFRFLIQELPIAYGDSP